MLSHGTAVGCRREPAVLCGSLARGHLAHPRNTQYRDVDEPEATTDFRDPGGPQRVGDGSLGPRIRKSELASTGPHCYRQTQGQTVRRDGKHGDDFTAKLEDESLR